MSIWNPRSFSARSPDDDLLTTVVGHGGTPYRCPDVAAVDAHIVRLYRRIGRPRGPGTGRGDLGRHRPAPRPPRVAGPGERRPARPAAPGTGGPGPHPVTSASLTITSGVTRSAIIPGPALSSPYSAARSGPM